MKRVWGAALGVVVLFNAALLAQESVFPVEQIRNVEARARALENTPDVRKRVATGEKINHAFVALTGEAVNPLLGITILGVRDFFLESSGSQSVYAHPMVWGPLVAIMLVMFFNSAIVSWIPGLSAPLNALGAAVNAGGAIVMLPIVLAVFMESCAEPVGGALSAATQWTFPEAMAAESSYDSAGNGLWLSVGYVASLIIGTFVFISVWVTSFAVDILVLIIPWAPADIALKGLRLCVVATLTALNFLSPALAIWVAVAVVIFSILFFYAAVKIIQKGFGVAKRTLSHVITSPKQAFHMDFPVQKVQ